MVRVYVAIVYLLASTLLGAACAQTLRDVSKDGQSMQITSIIDGIKMAQLIHADFFFDGGSLVFAFSAQDSPSADFYVFIRRNDKASVDGQSFSVIVSPHLHLSRYAFIEPKAKSGDAFRALISTAEIRSDKKTKVSLSALNICKAAIVEGIEPRLWGLNAITGRNDEDTFGGSNGEFGK